MSRLAALLRDALHLDDLDLDPDPVVALHVDAIEALLDGLPALEEPAEDALCAFVTGLFVDGRLHLPASPDPEATGLHWPTRDQHHLGGAEHPPLLVLRLSPTGARRLRLVLDTIAPDPDGGRTDRRRFLLREPVHVDQRALTCRFELRVPHPEQPRQPSQRRLNREIAARIRAAAPPSWTEALQPLDDALDRYTRRRPLDRFVHATPATRLQAALDDLVRDLLDGIERLSDPAPRLATARTVREVGGRIVGTLARLEEARRRLFLSRRLVLRTDWLVSRSVLPDLDLPPAQRLRWEALYGADHADHPGCVVDTALLPPDLAGELVASLPPESGLVVRGDNLDALRLLEPGHRGRVRLTCIDPPYNTGSEEFPYRDAWPRPAWLSMMADRLALARRLATRDGAIAVHIDDAELHRLTDLLTDAWGPELAKLVWDRNRKNDARFFSVGHEYLLVHAADEAWLRESGVRLREPKEGVDQARAVFRRLRHAHGEDWEAIRAGWLAWFDDIPLSDPRRRMMRFTRVGPRGPFRDDGDVSWPGGGGPRFEVRHPQTGRPVRIPSRGWVYPTAERFWEAVADGRVVFGADETTSPRVARYLFEADGQVMPSVFYSYAQTAAQELEAIFGHRAFGNPKNWRDLARMIRYLGDPGSTVLDFFGGSGSTAHAVLALNRDDGGTRRFVLVEAGEHGDTVLLPRIQKLALAEEWREGRPVRPDPIPVVVRVLRLSSFAHTLSSLADRGPGALRFGLDADGGLRLEPERFDRPFACTLCVDGHEVPVDLVETFGLLLGLRVERRWGERGVAFVLGRDPKDLQVLTAWRDREAEGFAEQVDEARARHRPDLLYVNGGPWPGAASTEEAFRAHLLA